MPVGADINNYIRTPEKNPNSTPILTACVAAGIKHEHSGRPKVQRGENVVTVKVFYRYRAVLAAVREIF